MNLLIFILALAASTPEAKVSIPIIEQVETDPKYKRVESRQLIGRCAAMDPLAAMLSNNDGVKIIVEVACDNVMFTPPTDGNTAVQAFMAFVMSKTKKGTYFRGVWDNGDFSLNEVSFDQLNWFKVIKGKVRIYKNKEADTMMFVGFAVFENDKRKGLAFRFEN